MVGFILCCPDQEIELLTKNILLHMMGQWGLKGDFISWLISHFIKSSCPAFWEIAWTWNLRRFSRRARTSEIGSKIIITFSKYPFEHTFYRFLFFFLDLSGYPRIRSVPIQRLLSIFGSAPRFLLEFYLMMLRRKLTLTWHPYLETEVHL
jgi:hypothetical protein